MKNKQKISFLSLVTKLTPEEIADNSLNSVIADNSVKYILDNPQKFGMEYIKLERRSI